MTGKVDKEKKGMSKSLNIEEGPTPFLLLNSRSADGSQVSCDRNVLF